MQKDFVYSHNGWVAAMATYLAATRNIRINRYQLIPSNGHLTRNLENYYRGGTLPDPTNRRIRAKKLDSLGLSEAIKQIRADLRVLDSVLPSHSIRRARVDVVGLDPARRQYALSITLEIRTAHDLDGHIGDLLLGFDSGLGVGSDSLIEGLAVVASTRTQPLVGAWGTVRNVTGRLEFAPSIHYSCFETTIAFPDLTGGPRVRKGDAMCHG